MGQYWELVNIDKQQTSGQLGQLGKFFYRQNVALWLQWMIQPVRAPPPMPRIPKSEEVENTNEGKPGDSEVVSAIQRMPTELLLQIGSYAINASVADLICLAATCHHLWDVLSPFITTWAKTASRATWSGDRLIGLGDYMDDLPNGVLTDEEAALLRGESKDESTDQPGQEANERTTLCYYASLEHYSLASDPRAGTLLSRAIQERRLAGAPLAAILKMIEDPEMKQPQVLRNLSKKCFVRSEAIIALNKTRLPGDGSNRGSDDGGNHGRSMQSQSYCLGHVLFSRICWSSEPSCSISDPPGYITRGPWAGDRFDLILEKNFKEKDDFEAWKDVSEGLCGLLESMWGHISALAEI